MYQPDGTHPDVRIGHVHLRVADLERATAFYRDVLGFTVTAYGPDVGLPGVAFLAAGGYHHHVGLNTWRGVGVGPAPADVVGLRHFTVVLEPDALAAVRARLTAAGVALEYRPDAVLARDPAGNALLFTTSREAGA